MVLVFGTRSRRYPIGYFRSPCRACGAVTDHLRAWDKTVAHVWFIPLFPVRSKRVVICGGCGTVKPDRPELDGVPVGGIFGMPAETSAAR
jgi:hypothetical protein